MSTPMVARMVPAASVQTAVKDGLPDDMPRWATDYSRELKTPGGPS
jgi:hypothetical protein